MRFRRMILACALCFLAGCGLSDYEQRAETQRLRLKQYDEENLYLAAPMDPPWTKTKEGSPVPVWPFDVHIRPFKGVVDKADDPPFVVNNVALYRFPGKDGYSLFLAVANIGELDKNGQYKFNEFSVVDFRQRVRGALESFYVKEYKAAVPFHNEPVKRVTIKPFTLPGQARPDLEFDGLEFGDWPAAKEPTAFFVNYFQKDARQLAIVHQVPLRYREDPAVRKALELSLKSLAIEKDARDRREEYARTHKP